MRTCATAAGWNAAGFVFVSENGTPIRPTNLRRQFDRILKRADVAHVRFHDTRHTYAALSIAAGMNMFTLSPTHKRQLCAAQWNAAGRGKQGKRESKEAWIQYPHLLLYKADRATRRSAVRSHTTIPAARA
jgi:hypothetical protein